MAEWWVWATVLVVVTVISGLLLTVPADNQHRQRD